MSKLADRQPNKKDQQCENDYTERKEPERGWKNQEEEGVRRYERE